MPADTYAYTNVWWADLLTIFDGELIAYEGQTYNYSTKTVTGTVKSGNPVCYYNGTRWDMEWSDGRRLALASNENSTIFYTYDLNGIRTSKTVNGVKHEYTYASGRLLRETYGNVVLDFAYDASGRPFSLTYKAGSASAVTYYYITNLQGDVMYLVNSSGTRVASYTYDPYGKVDTATGTMAAINPLCYRGYYYDTETGFYYVSSRYYDPLICRFINADGLASTGQGFPGHNMFAYCNNNPIHYIDSDGNMATEATIAATNWWNPVGWLFAAVVVVEVVALVIVIDETTSCSSSLFEANDTEKVEPAEPEIPDVTYPGDDPTKAPEGTEWRGSGKQGSKQGNYYNPQTGESWHPDLDHPEPIGPHWDYRDPNGTWWRIGNNNIPVLK